MKFDLFIIACILIGADALDTIMVLKEGGREINPWMRSLIAKMGVSQALVSTHGALVILMAVVYSSIPGYAFGLVALAYFAIMLNNLYAYIKQGKK